MKKKFLFLLLVPLAGLFIGAGVPFGFWKTAVSSGPITFYASNTSTGGTVNITFAAPLSAGYVVAAVMVEPNAGMINAADFDGAAMTYLGQVGASGYGGRYTVWFGLAVGSKAAGTYTVSYSGGTAFNWANAVMAYNNVNQGTSTGVVSTTGPDGANPQSLTPASSVGDVVVAVAAPFVSTVSSLGGTQTQRADVINGGGAIEVNLSDAPATAGSTAISATYTLSTASAFSGVSLKPL